MQMGVKFTKDSWTLRSEALVKWYFMPSGTSSVALYGGFRSSKDGATLLLGFKVGCVKLIFPVLVMCPTKKTERTKDFEYAESDQLQMFATYLMGQLLFGWLNRRKRN